MDWNNNQYWSNVIVLKRPENAENHKDCQTNQKVIELLNIWNSKLKKEDIISAIIMWEGTVSDPNTVNHMMGADYFELYEELLDMICEHAWIFYHSQWFDLEYDTSELKIYFIDSEKQCPKIELDIELLPNTDFSDITIQLMYKWEILFIANSQWAGCTWKSPMEIDQVSSIQNDTYLHNLSEIEKSLIYENKCKHDTIISAITSNFSEYIVSQGEIIESLLDYSRFQLIEMLIDMIVNNYWEDYNLIINPFTPLLIQKIHTKNLENISFQLTTDPDTYKTSIEVINEKWNALFKI